MNKHVQIRNLPASTHRKLKARAAREGMSMSDYLRIEIEKLLSLPSPREWLEMVRKRKPMALSQTAADIIREERDSR
jgi:plasmid stability protein